MEVNNLLSIPIYEFQCDEKLSEEIYNQAVVSKFTSNKTNKISDREHYYNANLFEWFDKCIDQVSKIYFLNEISLPIISCWINKTSKLEKHHSHQHPNSILSGIFYLTTHSKAETVFYYKNPYYEMGANTLIRASKHLEKDLVDRHTTIMGKVAPEKGKLILFPSSLIHGTRPNTDSHARYSISFNTFFSGKIHDRQLQHHEESVSSDIILQPVTVRQQYEPQ
jgi:uncharacterized protein (TIGR02466 family)